MEDVVLEIIPSWLNMIQQMVAPCGQGQYRLDRMSLNLIQYPLVAMAFILPGTLKEIQHLTLAIISLRPEQSLPIKILLLWNTVSLASLSGERPYLTGLHLNIIQFLRSAMLFTLRLNL